MTKQVECRETASGPALNAVNRILRTFNQGIWDALKNSDRTGRDLRLVLRDSNKVIGGLIATTRGKWLRISIMAVEESHRRRGLGARLIERAERAVRRRGCVYSYVDTMSYQAPGFYRKLGYRQVGRLADWDSHGHHKVFFVKRLGR
jgi:predicted N-acetyltransferase YhbS